MANQIRFTLKALDKELASSVKANAIFRDTDCKGLTAVKYAKTGDLSFVYSGRIKGGKKRDITLGRYPSLSIAEARKRALEYTRMYRDGIDPVEVQAEEARKKESELALGKALQVTLRATLEQQLFFRLTVTPYRTSPNTLSY